MSAYFFLFLPPGTAYNAIVESIYTRNVAESSRISLNHAAAEQVQVDDRMMAVSLRHEVILPAVCKVTYVNRAAKSLTLEVEERYNRPCSVQPIRQLPLGGTTTPAATVENFFEGRQDLQALWQRGTISTALPQTNFESVIRRMGGKRMEEKALLNHIKQYTLARGYYFDEETLCNYHICLKTRPFVILAGLSGTGKSKLTQLYAEALGAKYLRLAVRPNWNDDRYLLGYLNTLTGKYMTEPALDFVLDANRDEHDLHFFCLDEMNLAHVEYYFSQFLSAMEEEDAKKRKIALISPRSRESLDEPDQALNVPDSLLIPTNLLFTGTINVDETTHPISDKVIDRANTIEFFTVDLDKIPQDEPMPTTIGLASMTWQSYRASTPDITYRTQIIEIGKILNRADLGLGYRVVREMEMYLANSKGLLEPLVAFDLQMKQRILPRVRGANTKDFAEMLEELLTFTKRNRLPRSQRRLEEMQNRLKRDGYTSFWR